MKKIIVICLIMLLTVGIVFANGMPTSEEDGGSGQVTINVHSNISLIEETIIYESKSRMDPEYSDLDDEENIENAYVSSRIKVIYNMKCGPEAEDTIMYFVSPRFMDFKVSLDGKSILDELELTRMPSSIEWVPESLYLSYEIREDMNDETAKIPLSFKAGEEKTLTIEYISSSSWDGSSGNVHDIFRFVYYLTPARYWLGDTKVNLELNLASELTYESNIKLDKIDTNRYTTTLDKIPDKEWSLYISHKGNRYFKTNSATLQNLIFIVLLVLLYKSYRLIKKEPVRSIYQILVYILCVVIWYFVNLDIIGYPFGPIFVWAGYFIIGVIIPIRLVINDHNRKRYGI